MFFTNVFFMFFIIGYKTCFLMFFILTLMFFTTMISNIAVPGIVEFYTFS